MKKLLTVAFCMLMLASCSDQLTETDLRVNQALGEQDAGEYQHYLEKARWGDANAYRKLADFYRTGVGVNADFISMTAMLAMAEQYNRDLRVDDYMKALPEEDGYKQLFNTMDKFNKKDMDKVKSTASALIADGKPEGYVIRGAMQVEEGDTLGGLETIRYGADQGSSFGELILHMSPAFLYNHKKPFDAPGLIRMAERHPFAYKFLAEMYAGEVCDSVVDEELAAEYYLKADAHGFLGRNGATWLLDYYSRNGISIDEQEKGRLVTLAGGYYEEQNIEEDTSSLSDWDFNGYLDSLARQHIADNGLDKTIVYVVETKTGRLVGQSSLKKDGGQIAPFIDTFDRENEYLHGVASYLALLWTGNVMPSTIFHTGSGVYEDGNGNLIKDYNWRRGGYGDITLEYALTHRSNIAFAKAIEQAYGHDRKVYDEQIAYYHNGNPNTLMGMLTFYNAIANGGKMVEICEPDEIDVNVISDQIAYPEYIKPVQQAMERCVSEGLFQKAGNEYRDVAACGRTLRITDATYRLELCGYFPTKNPQYTIMVVMEKEGLPASSGETCGPLFSQVVVGLLTELK